MVPSAPLQNRNSQPRTPPGDVGREVVHQAQILLPRVESVPEVLGGLERQPVELGVFMTNQNRWILAEQRHHLVQEGLVVRVDCGELRTGAPNPLARDVIRQVLSRALGPNAWRTEHCDREPSSMSPNGHAAYFSG
jgi:hypothetical protein